jgi:hypothetical protein
MKKKSIWESLERERKAKAKKQFLKALKKDPALLYGVLVTTGELAGKDLTQMNPEDIEGVFLTLAKLGDKDVVVGIGIGKHQIEISMQELVELIEEAFQDKITNILRPPKDLF